MAQYSMNAYDADIYIPGFKGLMQYGDQMGSDLRYSPDCMNVETPGGVLQPAPLMDTVSLYNIDAQSEDPGFICGDIGTIMYLREEFPSAVSSDATHPIKVGNHTVSNVSQTDTYLIAVSPEGGSGGIYLLRIRGEMEEFGDYEVKKILDYSGEKISWCTYEYSDNSGSYNVLLFTLVGTTSSTSYVYSSKSIGPSAWPAIAFTPSVPASGTLPAQFRYIAVFADRIWGCGLGFRDDTLYYSKPYKYYDWDQDNDDPAAGGGDIRIPTFDKDEIVALVPFGDALIVFSKKRAWRITGSNPSNFIVQEQYGNGCPYPETIGVLNNRIIMLTEGGLSSYDGYQVTPFMREATADILKELAFNAKQEPRATVIDRKYVLTLSNELGLSDSYYYSYAVRQDYTPLPNSSVNDPTDPWYDRHKGYHLIVYDDHDGTITQMDTPKIVSFCRGTPYALTYRQNPASRDALLMRLRFNSWETGMASGAAVKWVSPWITLGRKDIQKSGFDVYITPEVKKQASTAWQRWSSAVATVAGEDTPSIHERVDWYGRVTFKLSIQTEKKTKTKYYTVEALSDEDVAAGKKLKQKRLHFGGSGRRFRLIIEVEAHEDYPAMGNYTPWRLIGGIHIISEIDKD